MLATALFATPATVTLGEQCGYVLYEEQIHLNAEVSVIASSQQPVSIQLWACQQAFEGGILDGHKIASTSPTYYTESSFISEQLVAIWPIGQQAYAMVLVLVEGDTILSYVNFSQSQTFLLPYLSEVKTQFTATDIYIDIGQIYSPRAQDNLSGTLSLELWAVSAPYLGDPCEGELLTIQLLGVLAGQGAWTNYQLTASVPSHAKSLVLLLREWTAKGYVTRDYVSLSVPVADAEPVATAIESTPEPVVETMTETIPPEVVSEVAVEAIVETVEVIAEQPELVLTPDEPAPVKAKKTSKKTTTAPAAKAAAKNPALPSLNEASVEQLCSIKGISQAVARTIVESRPYKAWEEVKKLKGVGGILFARLQELFHI